MKIIVLCVLAVCGYFGVHCQSTSEQYSIDWLKDNLTYSYLNREQGKWWLNKFELNYESGIMHIQNASSKNPAKISGKSWIDRRVKLSQLDPYSISIDPVYENKGRVIRGSVLIIHTLNNKKSISKTIDGTGASAESFLQFAIPDQLQEKSPGFADSLKFHLSGAIEWDAKTIKATDDEANIESVFNVLKGEFLSGSVTRTYTQLFERTIEYQDRLGSKPLRKGFFGFDEDQRVFYETIVEAGGLKTYTYKISDEDKLTLISQNEPSRKIRLASLLHLEILTGSGNNQFRRLSYD